MRIVSVFCLAFVALSLTACGEKPSEPQTGIEIGNPSIGLSAQFVLDYGAPDYSAFQGLGKLPSDSEPMVITDFNLGLSEVRHLSSYYVHMPTDPLIGLRVWPRSSTVDTLVYLKFDTNGTSIMPFTDWRLPAKSYLKEVAFFLPIARQEPIAIRGQLLVQGTPHDFEYQLPDWQTLQLRYHVSQIEQHLNDSILNLPVRFHVPNFIQGISFDSALADNYNIIRFNSTANTALWEALNANFAASFNSLRYARTLNNGTLEWGYPSESLPLFNIPGKNWIRDSLFQDPAPHWIYVQQLGGQATIQYKSNHTVEIDIKQGGSEVFSIQFIQENIPLIEGKKYRIAFQASSSVGSEIVARIGLYHSPYSNLSPDFNFGLYDGMGTYHRDFTATTTNLFGRLEFNLGGYERKIILQNIQVIQLD